MSKHTDKFERAMTDHFEFKLPDLGELERLEIGHDGSGIGAGWFLDKVVVTLEEHAREWRFHANRWLDEREGDGELECELIVGSMTYGPRHMPRLASHGCGTRSVEGESLKAKWMWASSSKKRYPDCAAARIKTKNKK